VKFRLLLRLLSIAVTIDCTVHRWWYDAFGWPECDPRSGAEWPDDVKARIRRRSDPPERPPGLFEPVDLTYSTPLHRSPRYWASVALCVVIASGILALLKIHG
jgi:hypothetical protein